MEIFRYRSFEHGLQEITNQTIYFAARNELNDLVEGYLIVYWEGDKIAWNGLFKNYVCSLYRALLQYLLQGKEADIRQKAAMEDVHHFDDVPLGKILQELGDSFLQHDLVQRFSDIFDKLKVRISRDDLIICLRFIHHFALIDTFNSFLRHGYESEEMRNLCSKLQDQTARMAYKAEHDEIWAQDQRIRQKLFHHLVNIYNDTFQQIYASVTDSLKKVWLTVMADFPKAYVDHLEEFIHPDVFMACFSGNGNDNSMWGQYAEKHCGMCMIYEPHMVNGRNAISLLLPYAYSNNGKADRYQDGILYQVNYGGTVQEANFFTMLGRFIGKQLHDWLSDNNGNRSRCLNQIYDNEETWRKEYWECLYDRYCHKTKDWSHENEFRLLLIDTFYEFSEHDSRIVKYQFSNLKGVILGMQMPPENRAKVLNAIRNKCEETGRADFEVYVAEYDHNTDSITRRRISVGGRI